MARPETSDLAAELAAYEANKALLLSESAGKYVLIHRDKILDTFADEADAIAAGYNRVGNVPFLVKLITAVETPIHFASNSLGFIDAGLQCAGD